MSKETIIKCTDPFWWQYLCKENSVRLRSGNETDLEGIAHTCILEETTCEVCPER